MLFYLFTGGAINFFFGLLICKQKKFGNYWISEQITVKLIHFLNFLNQKYTSIDNNIYWYSLLKIICCANETESLVFSSIRPIKNAQVVFHATVPL
jgi:hypothetical protein